MAKNALIRANTRCIIETLKRIITMDKVQGKIWDVLCGMDGEAVARLFTSYYGLQILTREFAEHMIDEGASDAYELGIDDEYEEYDDEED